MYSKLLVLFQFTIIAGIVQYCEFPFDHPFLLSIGVCGGLIGATAIITMRWQNLRIQPVPKPDGQLITVGIYRWIRHPMYLSVLLVMVPFIIHLPDMISLTLYLSLMTTLFFKMKYEEQLLAVKYPMYSEYMSSSYRLIPFIY